MEGKDKHQGDKPSARSSENTGAQEISDIFLGRTLAGKYRIIEKLGGGGMGAVYRAEHLALARDVAVKVLHPHLVSDKEHLARFQREARTAFSLKHPNIITLHDFGVDGEYPYLVMEFINGKTLKQLLRTGGEFPLERVQSVTRQVLSALSVAHRRGVVHRDLKPDNIMISVDADGHEEAHVLDFGIAKVISGGTEADLVQTQAGIVFGSPQYLAPEQVLEKPLDARTDLYALGSILYEVITGQKTFPSSTGMASIFQRVNEDPPPLTEIRSVRKELNRFVMKLLSRNPDDRYSSADECLEELEYAFSGKRVGKTNHAFSYGLLFIAVLGAGYILGEVLFSKPESQTISEKARRDIEALQEAKKKADEQKRFADEQKRKADQEAAVALQEAERIRRQTEELQRQAENAKKLVEQYRRESEKAAEEVERYQEVRVKEERRLKDIQTRAQQLSELADKKKVEARKAEALAREQKRQADRAKRVALQSLEESNAAREQAESEAERLRAVAERAAIEAKKKQAEAEFAASEAAKERAASQRETEKAIEEFEVLRTKREAELKRVEDLQNQAEAATKSVEPEVAENVVSEEAKATRQAAKRALEAERKRMEAAKRKLEEDRKRLEQMRQRQLEEEERRRKALIAEEAERRAEALREQQRQEEEEARERERERRRKFPRQGKRR